MNPVAILPTQPNQPNILTQFQHSLVELQHDCLMESGININHRTIERFLKTCFDNGYHEEKFTALTDISLELHMVGRHDVATSIYRQLKELSCLPKNLCEQAGIYYWFLSIKSDINDFVKWFQPIANDPNRPIAACFFAKAILDHGITAHNLKIAIRYFDISANMGYLPASERLHKANLALNSLENPDSTSQHQFTFDAMLSKSKFDRQTTDKEITLKRKKTSLPDSNPTEKSNAQQPADHTTNHPNSSLTRSSSSPAKLDTPKDDVPQLTVVPPTPKRKSYFSRGHSKSVNEVPDSVQQKREGQTPTLNPPPAPGTRSASNSPPTAKVMPMIKEGDSEESSF